jgi:uncharacterized protein YggE
MSQGEDAATAQNQVNEIVTKAIGAIKAAGISAEKIRTTGITLHPIFSQPPPGPQNQPHEPKIVGYRASNTVRVEIDDISKVGSVIDAGVGAGANQLQGLTFELKDDLPQRREALKIAVTEARTKAISIAEALGTEILGIYEAVEGGVQILRPQIGRLAAQESFFAATPVEPGQVRIESNVTVSFVIRP